MSPSPQSTTEPDVRIAVVAGRQHGVVCAADAYRCGLTYKQISIRVRTGRWFVIHPGVYALGHDALSPEGAWMAAALAGGPGSVLTSWCAGKLMNVSRFAPRSVDVLVPRRHRPVPGLRVHQTRDLPREETQLLRRIPVTSLARTLVELAAAGLTEHQLANVLHEAAFRNRLDLRRLRRAIDRHTTRPGHARLVLALALHEAGSVGTRSGAEDDYLAAVRGLGLPTPLVNTCVIAAGREREVDFLWLPQRLCVEVDGHGHDRPGSRREDAMRDADLRQDDFRLLRVRADAIAHGARETARLLDG